MTKILNSEMIAARLRNARKRAGLTQDQAASLIDAARTTVIAIEQGKRHLRFEEWIALTRGYGVDPEEMLNQATKDDHRNKILAEMLGQMNPEQRSVVCRLLQAEPGIGAMQTVRLMACEMPLAGIEDVACALLHFLIEQENNVS